MTFRTPHCCHSAGVHTLPMATCDVHEVSRVPRSKRVLLSQASHLGGGYHFVLTLALCSLPYISFYFFIFSHLFSDAH